MLRKTAFVLLVLSLAAVTYFHLQTHSRHEEARLTVYCAAGLKGPLEAVAKRYEKETGVMISLQYGGTGTLLTQLRVANQGDLFLAADEGSLAEAERFNLIREVLPVALQHPVLAVAQGNPKNIRSLDDLLRPEVRLALTNPEAASIGKVTQRLLGPQWPPLAARVHVMKPTVTEVAADLRLGTVDAAFVWDSLLSQYQDLEAIRLPGVSGHEEKASAAVLHSARSPEMALRFARYLAAPEQGGDIFREHGFLPAGDRP